MDAREYILSMRIFTLSTALLDLGVFFSKDYIEGVIEALVAEGSVRAIGTDHYGKTIYEVVK